MEQLINNTYKLKNPDKNKLQSLGFRYSVKYSTSDCAIYYYRFPVHKYKTYTTLECEIYVNTSSGDVEINVYDENNNIYPPFYNIECGNYEPLMESVNHKIVSELKRIGVSKVKS